MVPPKLVTGVTRSDPTNIGLPGNVGKTVWATRRRHSLRQLGRELLSDAAVPDSQSMTRLPCRLWLTYFPPSRLLEEMINIIICETDALSRLTDSAIVADLQACEKMSLHNEGKIAGVRKAAFG